MFHLILSTLFFLIYALPFCYGCLPTPTVEVCPTITYGTMLELGGICLPCRNLHMGCPYLIGDCTSSDPALLAYMQTNCRLTCQFCTPSHECGTVREITGNCPRDWRYNPATNKCYFATGFRDLYTNIEATCTAIYSTVASVTDSAENVWLANYLPSSDKAISTFGTLVCYFIGLRRNPTWATAYWTDGNPSTYRNWDTASPPMPAGFGAQPNGMPGEENAILCHPGSVAGVLVINDYTWHDDYNTESYPGFCKRDACPPLVTT